MNEYREQRTQAITDARAIIDTADKEGRDLSTEEQEQVDTLFRSADDLEAKINNQSRRDELAKREASLKVATRRVTPNVIVRGKAEPSARAALNGWARRGEGISYEQSLSCDHFGINPTDEKLELRSLTVGTDGSGGYSVPTLLQSEYEKKLAYYFNVLNAVSSFNTPTGADLQYPKITDTTNAAGIVAEEGTIGTTTDPTFDAPITFKCWDYFSPIVLVSFQLLRDSVFDVASLLLNDLFPERHARAMETAVVGTNAGTTAPQGLLNGVSAGVNLASGNALTWPKLIDLEVSVDIAYRSMPGTGFLMHDATWGAVRKIADDNQFPIFAGDLQNGVQPRLLGYPVYISNRMTSIASAGDNTVHILFGALQKYKIRFVGGPVVTRLNELYAATGQVGFCLSQSWDGRYVGHSGCVKTLNAFDSP